jgi:hypothetical protein
MAKAESSSRKGSENMKGEGRFRFTAEEAFSIPGRGLVVTGKVEEGSISVGTEIGFLATDGKRISALVVAIEISRRLVEEAKVGQRASILLQGVKKEQITLGTVLQDVPVAPVATSAPPVLYSPPPVAAAPPTTSGGEPIHPSSSSWRTILFIIIGILVILGILYLQGKWDPKKWDPKKWDPRKRITSIQSLKSSDQQSANGSKSIPIRFENFRHFSAL